MFRVKLRQQLMLANQTQLTMVFGFQVFQLLLVTLLTQ